MLICSDTHHIWCAHMSCVRVSPPLTNSTTTTQHPPSLHLQSDVCTRTIYKTKSYSYGKPTGRQLGFKPGVQGHVRDNYVPQGSHTCSLWVHEHTPKVCKENLNFLTLQSPIMYWKVCQLVVNVYAYELSKWPFWAARRPKRRRLLYITSVVGEI